MAGFVEFGDYTDLEVPINTDFSLVGWLYVTVLPSAGEIGYIYCKGSATGAGTKACHFSVDENGIVTFGIGDDAPTSGASAIPVGEWVFIWGIRIGTGTDNTTFGWSTAASEVFDTSYKGVTSDNTAVGDTATKATFFAKDDASGDDSLVAKVDHWLFSDSHGYTNTELTALYNNGKGTEFTSISGRSNRIYFSDNGDFDTYTAATQYIDIPTNNKQQSINCLAEYYDSLVIGLSNEIWTLYGSGGDPEVDWALKKSNSAIGMKDLTDTTIINGLLMFVSPDNKVWAFDGNSSFQIGEKLADIPQVGHQTLVNYKGDLYGILSGGGTYSYDSQRELWRKSDQSIRSLFTDGVYLFGGSNSSTRVFQLEETNAMGANAVNGYWESRWEDFGIPKNNKTIYDIWVFCKEQTHGGNLNITMYKDHETTEVITFNVSQALADNPQNGQQLIADLTGVRGKHWKMKIWNDQANQPYEIEKIAIRYTDEED